MTVAARQSTGLDPPDLNAGRALQLHLNPEGKGESSRWFPELLDTAITHQKKKKATTTTKRSRGQQLDETRLAQTTGRRTDTDIAVRARAQALPCIEGDQTSTEFAFHSNFEVADVQAYFPKSTAVRQGM